MKNFILVSSTICTIAMMLFIHFGNKRINNAQEASMAEAKEWMEDIEDQFEAQGEAYEEAEAARVQYSERMKDLSRLQEGLAKEMAEAAASQGPQADRPRPGTTANPFATRQSAINNEYQRLYVDLSQHLQGIADQRHLEVLDSMKESKIINDLRDLKARILSHDYGNAVDPAMACALKMAQWGVGLEND